MNYQQKVDAIDWDNLILTVKRTASPGVPYSVYGSENHLVLQDHSVIIQNALIERLDLLLAFGERTWNMDAKSLVDCHLVDPVRIFVKNELHKVAKTRTGKVRLICSISLVDQLVEKVLYGALNNHEIEHWDEIPSKPGFGLLDDESVDKLVNGVTKMYEEGGPIIGSDMRNNDWTVQAWELAAECDLRCRLMQASVWDDFHWLARARFGCLARSVFVLSNGSMYAQLVPGVMKSGCYVTASATSRIRVLEASLLGVNAMSMGDDCIENVDPFLEIEGMRRFYYSLGHEIKDIRQMNPHDFEFCSHRFIHGKVIPLNWMKMYMNLIVQSKITIELIFQFVVEMKDSPYLFRLLRLLVESDRLDEDCLNYIAQVAVARGVSLSET